MYFTLDMIFMSASILAGFYIFFQYATPLHLKLLPFFLVITLANELVAGYLVDHGNHTTILYNIYDIVHFAFYLYLLTNIIAGKKARSVCKKILIGYLVFVSANITLFQRIETYNSVTYAIGCLLIVALSIYYFYELFSLKHFVNLIHEPSFWISTGLLFYYSCSFPLFTLVNFMHNTPDIIIGTLQSLIQLMNILLYSLFTIAFLCRIRIRKYISLLL